MRFGGVRPGADMGGLNNGVVSEWDISDAWWVSE